MTVQFVRSLGGARHPGYPVPFFTTDTGEHTSMCFVHRLWFVWNQSLTNSPRLIINDQSARWNAPGVRLRPGISVGTHLPREGSA